MKNFKKLDEITFDISKKILKKYDSVFIKLNEEWLNIVGSELYHKTNPVIMSKDKTLTVEVKSNYVLEFQYKIPEIIENIQQRYGKKSLLNIRITQLY